MDPLAKTAASGTVLLDSTQRDGRREASRTGQLGKDMANRPGRYDGAHDGNSSGRERPSLMPSLKAKTNELGNPIHGQTIDEGPSRIANPQLQPNSNINLLRQLGRRRDKSQQHLGSASTGYAMFQSRPGLHFSRSKNVLVS